MANIREIAQKLLTELETQERESRLRAEGVVILFNRIHEQIEAETASKQEEPSDV